MSYETVLPKNFDINKLSYGKIKKTVTKDDKTGKEGSKTRIQVPLKYNNDLFVLQTPYATAPFGITNPMDSTEWKIDIDLDKVKTKGIEGKYDEEKLLVKLKEFKKVLEQIDEDIVEYIATNSVELLGQKKTPESVLENNYGPMINKSKNPEHSDKFKSKFIQPYTDTKRTFEAYDINDNIINWYSEDCKDLLKSSINIKWMLVQQVIMCTGLWVVGKKVYPSWKIISIRIRKPLVSVGPGFIKDDDGHLEEETIDEEIQQEETIDDVEE